MVDTPKTTKGIVVAIGLALAVALFLLTTNLWAFIVGVAIVALVLYVLYLVGVGGHQRLMNYLSGTGGRR
ncbi:hypothetical protein [Natronosalvus rutilus]|uniref:Uncharacterized protein n=1 Tax=Natronosalvus rutilus TaxID=2953753 RepID=A0A9E7N9C2_9EURY|nr:hypothetical protein [Natronosalvus rutilus]UTF52758.1 hypothetical protein NGM29_13325 [Natronosalvus rutilus]